MSFSDSTSEVRFLAATGGSGYLTRRMPARNTWASSRVLQGVWAALLCGSIGSGIRIYYPGNALLGTLAYVVLPLAVGLYYLRDLTSALTLAWINEVLCGWDGKWAEAGPISGRWMLMLAALCVFLVLGRLGGAKNRYSASALA